MRQASRASPIDDRSERRWTAGRGLIRGALAGAGAAVILAAVIAPVAVYFPVVAMELVLRSAVAFLIAWALFSVVHRAAGMVGWACTGLVVGLTLAVLVSQFIVCLLAQAPSPSRPGVPALTVNQAVWVLVVPNLVPMGAVMLCEWLRHDGGTDGSFLLDLLNQRV